MKRVSIGPGMFIKQRETLRDVDLIVRKQAKCPHVKRDIRGTCYECGQRERKVA